MARRKTTKRKTATVKRRRSTKKGMLSELFNPKMAQGAGKAVLSGAVGGASAGMLIKLLPSSMDPKMKSAYCIGAGFLSATILKMPNLGSGMAGVGMYTLLTQGGFLAEDSNFSYADDIEALPMVLDENGAGYLQDNGMYLQDNGMYLQEDDLSYDVGYYGAGFGLDNMN